MTLPVAPVVTLYPSGTLVTLNVYLPGVTSITSFPFSSTILPFAFVVNFLVLEFVPAAKAPLLLIVNADNASVREQIMEAVEQNTVSYHKKSQTMEEDRLDMIIEVRAKDDDALMHAISQLEGVTRCSLMSHDGEVTY